MKVHTLIIVSPGLRLMHPFICLVSQTCSIDNGVTNLPLCNCARTVLLLAVGDELYSYESRWVAGTDLYKLLQQC